MKSNQLNVRIKNQSISVKLMELNEWGFTQSECVRAGIVKFHELAKTNMDEAIILARMA